MNQVANFTVYYTLLFGVAYLLGLSTDSIPVAILMGFLWAVGFQSFWVKILGLKHPMLS